MLTRDTDVDARRSLYNEVLLTLVNNYHIIFTKKQ